MQTERRMCDVPVSFPSNFSDTQFACRSGIDVLAIGNLARKLVKSRYACRKITSHRLRPLFRKQIENESIPIISSLSGKPVPLARRESRCAHTGHLRDAAV